jgi:dTDP-4-amino-4,6-dideoxygalactose transaminase
MRALEDRFSPRAFALTDSGTSALTLALRIVVGAGNTVAFPAYVCVDLIAAARRANVRVRLYDVDPRTLSPDLDSVRRVVGEGVEAVTVVHLYGLPADVDAVRGITQAHGIPLIEDAAQHAGATLRGRRTGTLGDVSILSFGRGKGTTGGNGGALLTRDPRWQDEINAASMGLTPSGLGDVIGATASWLLGRPRIYNIPSSIPALHLGETVYHEAGEPGALSYAAATLLQSAFASADAHVAIRQRHAAALRQALDDAHAHVVAGGAQHIYACAPVEGGVGGYLRFPVMTGESTQPAPPLGIVRGYPRPLSEQPELHALLHPSREPLTGAHELARRLMTLPTHHMVTPSDITALSAWLRTA